jgi:hypothetical protein
MATSSGRLLVCVTPCVKFCVTPATEAPRPTREPAYTSWKVAAADLKPTVLELAMLLPMTSRLAAATPSPLMPWEKAMMVP